MDNIIIGKTYNLDLSGSAPVSVRPIEFIGEDRVLCEYLNSYAGRKEILDVYLFKGV